VSYWGEIFLGVIALATLTTSIILIALLIAAGRLARRIERLADRVERELTPAFGHLNAIARDAARATSLATAQVELVDRLFADVAHRVEQTLNAVQHVVAGPLRPGGTVAAALTAFRTAVAVIRGARSAHRRRAGRDDEDALFI